MLEYNMNVLFKDRKINTNLKELVQYDYNSMKINFTFDIDDIRFLFKLLGPDNTTILISEIDNNQLIIAPGVLNKVGYYTYEISAYGNDSKITDYAIGKFSVRKVLINTDEIVEPDDRVPILDDLINDVNQAMTDLGELTEEVNQAIEETNNLNIDVSKTNKIADIDLTKKDGTHKHVQVRDGYDFQYNWEGTSLGVKTDNEEEYEYVDLKGEPGNVMYATFEIVDGDLIEYTEDEYQGASFSLNNNGELEVII